MSSAAPDFERGFDSEVDTFLARLAKVEIPTPPGTLHPTTSGFDWLTSKDPLAQDIRALVLVLSSWPTEHAPWIILTPLLRLAIKRFENPTTCGIVGQCRYRYARRTSKSTNRCRGTSVNVNGFCPKHGG